jgi:hypothetical protein
MAHLTDLQFKIAEFCRDRLQATFSVFGALDKKLFLLSMFRSQGN